VPLPALFQKAWEAHESVENCRLTDTQVQVKKLLNFIMTIFNPPRFSLAFHEKLKLLAHNLLGTPLNIFYFAGCNQVVAGLQ
jgi:hypothetical protein